MMSKLSAYRSSRRLSVFSCKKCGAIRLLVGKRYSPTWGTMIARHGTVADTSMKLLSTRVLRKILKAQETLFKFGTMIPRSDREAEMSPEAVRCDSWNGCVYWQLRLFRQIGPGKR